MFRAKAQKCLATLRESTMLLTTQNTRKKSVNSRLSASHYFGRLLALWYNRVSCWFHKRVLLHQPRSIWCGSLYTPSTYLLHTRSLALRRTSVSCVLELCLMKFLFRWTCRLVNNTLAEASAINRQPLFSCWPCLYLCTSQPAIGRTSCVLRWVKSK